MRAAQSGFVYHVLNRGNARRQLFFKEGDYRAFLRVLSEAKEEFPMRLLAYCVMPNHFHIVLRPHADGDLGRFVQWLRTTHAQRYHRHYRTMFGPV